MSRGLAILATAAVTGSAFAAAVTLPTLVTLGSDAPPESLALPPAAGNRPAIIVKAKPLKPKGAHRHAKNARGGAKGNASTASGGPALIALARTSAASRPSS